MAFIFHLVIYTQHKQDRCPGDGAKSLWLQKCFWSFIPTLYINMGHLPLEHQTLQLEISLTSHKVLLLRELAPSSSSSATEFQNNIHQYGKSSLLWQEWTQERSMDFWRRCYSRQLYSGTWSRQLAQPPKERR